MIVSATKNAFVQVVVTPARAGTTPAAIGELARALQRWAEQQPGFQSRRVLYDAAADTYVDIIEWADRASGERAAKAEDHPCMDEMARLLDFEKMTFLAAVDIPLGK